MFCELGYIWKLGPLLTTLGEGKIYFEVNIDPKIWAQVHIEEVDW